MPVIEDNKEKNFLWRLKQDGIIEHLIVAVYTRMETNIQSSIKFGSWDTAGLKDGETMTFIRTYESHTW